MELPPAELAFYLWLARRALAGQSAVACPSDGAPDRDHARDFIDAYRAVIGVMGGEDRVTRGLADGMDKNYFERRKSRVNHRLPETLGPRPRTRYGLGLASGQILFVFRVDENTA